MFIFIFIINNKIILNVYYNNSKIVITSEITMWMIIKSLA